MVGETGSLISIETIKAIIKKEFRLNLYEQRSGVYVSKDDMSKELEALNYLVIKENK